MVTSSRLLIGLALVASAGIAGWFWLSPELAATPSRALPGLHSDSTPKPETLASTAAPAASAPVPIGAPFAGPSVVLSGVVVGVGGGNLAIVSVDRRPETMLRVGDEVASSAVVTHIDESSMTYRFAGQQLRVLVQPARSVAATANTQATAKPLPGFVVGAPTLARSAGTEPGSGNDAFRQAVARKTQAIAAGK